MAMSLCTSRYCVDACFSGMLLFHLRSAVNRRSLSKIRRSFAFGVCFRSGKVKFRPAYVCGLDDAFSVNILFIYVSIAFASASSITPSWNAPSMYVSRSSIIPLISATSWLAAFAAASAAAAAALAPTASSFRYCSIEILASSSRVVKRSNDELYVANAASTACFSAGVVAPSAMAVLIVFSRLAMSPKSVIFAFKRFVFGVPVSSGLRYVLL